MLNQADFAALLITLKLALTTTVALLVLGTPVAWWLSRSRWRFKFLLETIVALPLVLPPTVLGFYLLIALGPRGPIGGVVEKLGGESPVFTFTGLVIGSFIYSMPFVIQPLQDAFARVGTRPLEVAATLRASTRDSFFSVVIPLVRPAFVTAAILGFAHTVGEFGVVLMLGGSIPGKTKVASIAIYDHVEGLEYGHAHWLSGLLLVTSFLLLAVVYKFNRGVRVVQS